MGKYTDLKFGIDKKINSMISLGMKKAEMVELIHQEYIENGGTEKDWQENKIKIVQKNEYIRSIGSIQVMRSAAKQFENWAYENGVKKFEKVTREDLENYLKYRSSQGLSAWTISRDLHFVNKIFQDRANITKRELGLKSRLASEVKHNRSGPSKERPGLLEKHKDEITVILGTGARRGGLERLQKSDFIFKDGELIQCHLLEKNGRERWAWVLPQYREQIKAILRDAPDDGLMFRKPLDKHLNTHYFRGVYCKELINLLQEQKERNIEYYNGEIEKQGRISAYDREHYSNGYKGYDLDVMAEVSANMGHNRVSVIAKSYLY